MARGRTFSWQTADGRVLPLTKNMGYWVLQGVTGLGKPQYTNDLEARANGDGSIHRGSRAATRQVFLPMEVTGGDRPTLLSRLQTMGEMTNPKYGPGYLYITDGGKTYRLKCLYKDGMDGDEGINAAGETDSINWQRTGPVFEAVEPYFESPTLAIDDWGYSGALPFFPLPPVKLNPQQVLSDIGQPSRNNFVLNPSAETNALNFSNSALGSVPSSISRTAAAARIGSWAIRGEASADSVNGSLVFPDLAPSPFVVGNQYTFHAWVYVPSANVGTVDIALEIFFLTGGTHITARDQWVWARNVWTASSVGDRPVIALRSSDPTNTVPINSFFYADAIAVTEGNITSPDSYIDGDQLHCHWVGTPHASQSFQDPIYQPSIITNEGTVESYPVWKIVGPGSIVELINARSGRTFRLNLPTPLGSGDVVTIDTARGLVTDQLGNNLYQYVTADDFWPLEPGDNTVRLVLTSAGLGSQIVVTYYPRFESIIG